MPNIRCLGFLIEARFGLLKLSSLAVVAATQLPTVTIQRQRYEGLAITGMLVGIFQLQRHAA